MKFFGARENDRESMDAQGPAWGPNERWLGLLQALLRSRRPPSDRKFHRLCGVHSGTAAYVFLFLSQRWPPHTLVPLTEHGLCCTLWFLRTYPTDMEVLAVVRTLTSFYRVIWVYIPLLAQLLPKVKFHQEFHSVLSTAQPPLDLRFQYHAGPEHLKLKYSMVLDTMVLHCLAPAVRDKGEWYDRWKRFYCGEPKKIGYGIKLSIAVSVESHPRLLWVSCAPASAGDVQMEMGPCGLFSHLKIGETVLTDGSSEYVGNMFCRAPPHQRMDAYVKELDKMELSLQHC